MSLARYLPSPLRQLGRQIKWNRIDEAYKKRTGTSDFPPALLRVRVCGSLDIDGYKVGGVDSAERIIESIERAGIRRDDTIRLFDFGTGCGRILGPMIDRMPNATFTGSDIWDSAIEWNRGRFRKCQFLVNQFDPPLALPNEQFDVITAMSVFTHFDKPNQRLWLTELYRLAAPGGRLFLTVHGIEHAKRTGLQEPNWTELSTDGFTFVNDGTWSDFMPSGYQTSFQTREYTLKTWAEYVNIVDYYPGGWGDHDVVVIQKPS